MSALEQLSPLEQFVAQMAWCACIHALTGLMWDDPLFVIVCKARRELGGMFP